MRSQVLQFDAVVCVAGQHHHASLRVEINGGPGPAGAGGAGERHAGTFELDDATWAAACIRWLGFRRFSAPARIAEELVAFALGLRPTWWAVTVEVRGSTWAVATAQKSQSALVRQWEEQPWGRVEILHDGEESGLYLLHLWPSASIPWHHHRRMRELEIRVGGALLRSGQNLIDPSPREWAFGEAHRYDNVGSTIATVLACDEPRFQRDDEIEVPAPEGWSPPGERSADAP